MSDKKVLINPTSICVLVFVRVVCLSLRSVVLTLTVQIPQGRIVKTVNVALQQTAGGRKLQAVVPSSGQATLADAIADSIRRPAGTISSIPDSSGHSISRCSVGQRTDRGQGRGQRHGGGGGVFVWRAVQLTDTVVTKISSTADDDGMATKNRPVIVVVVEVGFKITRA